MTEPLGGAAVPASQAPPTPPRVSVIVTVLNDMRVERTLKSLLAQSLDPYEILVADGGSKDGTFELAQRLSQDDPRIHPCRLLGNIPESRNQALKLVRGDLVAFLDADEVAPPSWLAELVKPFSDPKVGFVGGPTPGMKGTVSSVGAQYYDAYLRKFYDTVAKEHPHALPMGNSAWRKRVFEEVGPLDTSLYPKAASEDQDMAFRALKAGWKGVYASEAPVDHDFSDITLPSLLRKQATYATGGYVLWRRTGSTYEASTGRVFPYILAPFLTVFGLLWWGVCDLFARSLVLVGVSLFLIGWWTFILLFVYLMFEGLRGERRYRGFHYRPLEILRRWATLWGALRGLLRYGWSGRKNLPPAPPRTQVS